jgi:DNA adenine methylase
LIFLNKTCFNGLYRTNKNGDFNVPYGRYKNPKICDKNNIYAVSKALENTTILCGDYTLARNYVCKGSLIYFDPPYRPLTKTASFTAYTDTSFEEKHQIELSHFFDECAKKEAYVILSNSDPKNEDPNDDFFELHYSYYIIERILAKRSINCIGEKRGEIYELLIRNYANT